ncbi:MAG: CDK5RAP3 family protein [Candidatus Thiodiazotropha sp. (ex Lucinoma annulata)]|nr:CDK5RAP3 family protein [Candidatus Thiodiazotropha sp. (ex Lucinoma borealis)]MCU7838384.1 CDK5RAP3 family protein [Candidatus Thiodiazotropha sp. (ex Troendleina suluensis)]MCU7882917.1 CDK5RAP3 family protein [Candidatus Thiodiazotropha sp. (ex Lucinoma annulata)]MCU7945466.1 CDK5RAP3 family protein [Candidatus Thiodiazotropha sp. (ex Cardiolucina cf. quadrata)]MCU7856259.1 CDK5RAP3 family protein [Candidatus Thiodiazotropha sp. (ex Lucinoma borealis)]
MPPPEKIVKKLLNLLDAGKKKDRAKCDRISDLLKQLKKQERITKDKLANEKDSVKRKRLSTDVKIIHTQRKKAIKRFKELKKKC